MKTETYVVLERDELSSVLNYRLIAECIGSSSWNSGKISREKDRAFTPSEIMIVP